MFRIVKAVTRQSLSQIREGKVVFVFFSKLLRIGFSGPAYGQGREVT